MRKGVIVFIAIAGTVAGIGAGAVTWHLSEPWRERRAFVGKCLANKFTEATCVCTYSAHKELHPSYAVLVKSLVHDDMTTFAYNASDIFGRKAAIVGTGIDPAEITNMLRAVEDRTVGKILRATGKFLVRHKYKVVGAALGGQQVMTVYRAGLVGLEVGQVAVVVEKHCGIVAASIPSTWERTKETAGSMWNATKDTADTTWQGTKKAAGQTWDGTKDVADKTWDSTKGAASWTWNKVKDLSGIGSQKESEK